MNSHIPRRQFMHFAGLGALAGAGLMPSGKNASGQTSGPGNQRPRLLVGCCAYSYRKYLDAKKMTMEEFILKGVEFGLNGVDMTAYWFKSTDPDYLLSLRYLALKNGMPFTGVGCGTEMLRADNDGRRKSLDEIKSWVDATDMLGASHLRVFAGALPKGATLAQGLNWTVETMKAACDYASKKGVFLGVETHGGITQKAENALEIIHRVNSSYAGITLDITHFLGDSDEDMYRQIEICIPHAVQSHIRDHFDNHRPIDLDRVWQMYAKAGYKGYMSLEYDDREDVMIAAPKMIQQMKTLSRKYSTV